MIKNHECEAVEKRLARIQLELTIQNLTPGQRSALIREQAALLNSKWEMLVPSSSHQAPANA